MSVSNQRSRFQCLRWLILALAILATPSLAHAGGAIKIGAPGLVIGADNDIYRYNPMYNTWVKENFSDQPVIDVADGGQYYYALAYAHSGGGYYLYRRPNNGVPGNWDWRYFDSPSKGVPIYGTKVTALAAGNIVAIVRPSTAATYQWIPDGFRGYWKELSNITAYDITTSTYCYGSSVLEGNLFFVSSKGLGYRWNGNGRQFTTYPGVTLKSIVGPSWNYNPTGLDTSGHIWQWVTQTTGSKWTPGWGNLLSSTWVYDLSSTAGMDGYQQPYVLEGSCSGGGYQVVEYVATNNGYIRTPVGPKGGCLY